MENITKEDARRLAIEDAERNAVEQVAGVTVSADTLVSNFTVSSDVISAIPYGKVIEREILTEDIQVIPPLNASIRGKDETNLPVCSTQTGTRPSSIYHVKMKVKESCLVRAIPTLPGGALRPHKKLATFFKGLLF